MDNYYVVQKLVKDDKASIAYVFSKNHMLQQ
jgi:hypothetical protein